LGGIEGPLLYHHLVCLTRIVVEGFWWVVRLWRISG